MSDNVREIRTRINENGRLVIPAPFRKALGIECGDEILLRVEHDELRIATLKNRVTRAQRNIGRYLGKGARLSEELIADRRAASQRE
jgi:AbrB family looped-hinge helix DNA binding protein